MPKLNPISGKKMLKLLALAGFKVIRTKGSHYFLKNNNGFVTTAPIHGNEDLGISIIKSILSDTNLNRGEYERLRKKA